ncbi:DNA-directed RNA polymerase I subunit RPA12 [Chelonus insularis]|uniref:DNA-directed RNA polymerase I subunit RPA12 n=1 Tax=Chelonus insularis TaxID=460826 RepID=UPI00158DBC34|nr:DNA-directed RNA polymerase I subunit RPA12 [Chelonus insularis]
MANEEEVFFETEPGFCPDCGSILPLLGEKGGVQCYACDRKWGPEVFGDMAMTYTLQFNDKNTYAPPDKSVENDDDEENAEGPVVDRKCSQCGNDKMSYATLQLRSADEGQTVFYTCTKCKFKETENS